MGMRTFTRRAQGWDAESSRVEKEKKEKGKKQNQQPRTGTRYSTVVKKKKGMEWVKRGGVLPCILGELEAKTFNVERRKKGKEKTLYRNNLSRVIYFQKERNRHGMEEIRRTGEKKELTKGAPLQ